ncbi:hypothetical protein NHQ30_006801 [Ciborinia camelliae]|nr:hypothetical protein NHQ30_006801 [Ciborinia camelliae]
MRKRTRDTVYFQDPPRKRICLDLNHYSTPATATVEIIENLLSLVAVQESLPNTAVQQHPRYSIVCFTLLYVEDSIIHNTDKEQVTHKRQTPLDHFYIFRWLPKELQLQIWAAAATSIDAQIITIESELHLWKPLQQINQYHQGIAYMHNESIFLTAQYIVPNILRACQDARQIALKYYRPVFAREIGGAPIYIAISDRRTPDTLLFKNLTALQMLRSRTQHFRIKKNDLDFIKSVILFMDVHKDPQSLRWIPSSLRELETLWIVEDKPCTCPTRTCRMTTVIGMNTGIQYILADMIISQRATMDQMKLIRTGYNREIESVRCLHNPEYCLTKWGTRVPETKVVSMDPLKEIAGQVVGRRYV